MRRLTESFLPSSVSAALRPQEPILGLDDPKNNLFSPASAKPPLIPKDLAARNDALPKSLFIEGLHPIFAIVGWRRGADVEILGSGVLIAPDRILTAGHVVHRKRWRRGKNREAAARDDRRRDHDRVSVRRYRVYSPWAGIKTIDEIRHWPDSADARTVPGDGIAVLRLKSRVPRGLKPLKLAEDRPIADSELHAFGYGGDHTGLLQAVRCRGGEYDCEDDVLCMHPSVRLGPRDSGAPLLISPDQETYEIAGVYAGLRQVSGANGNGPRFERFGLAIGRFQSDLKELSNLSSSGKPDRLELTLLQEAGTKTCVDDDLDPPAYPIGIDEIHVHGFQVSGNGSKTLILAVNSTVLPLRFRPRLAIRLFRDGRLVDRRGYPGPLQTIRIEDCAPGRWTVEIESETEVSYQVSATLYDG